MKKFILSLLALLPLFLLSACPGGGGSSQGSDPKDPEGLIEAQKKDQVRLIELGAEWCPPCRAMKPIMQAVIKDYKGRAVVRLVDLDQHRAIGMKYGVQTIPTQIFFYKGGKEVWRHVGPLTRADIDAKFREMGVK